MEGDPVAPPAAQTGRQGFFSRTFDDLKQRSANFGESLERFATGKQSFGSTTLQFMGQSAGGAQDVIGEALSSVVSTFTPQPVKDAVKNAGVAFLETPVGQAGLQAIKSGVDAYEDWKQEHPRDAANLESVVNIGSLLPVGAGAKAAAKPIARGFVGASRALGTALEPVEQGLRESAEKGVKQVLGATTKSAKLESERLAPELLNRPMKETFALTRKGMEAKATAGRELAGEAIDDLGELPGNTKVKTLIDALEAEKDQFVIDGVAVNPDAIENISSMQRLFEQYGDEVSNESLRKVRRLLDEKVYGAKGSFPTVAEGSKLDAQKMAADTIRGILAEAHPDLAKLNKEFTFWKNLEDVLQKTNLRTGSQSAGLVKNLATVAGAASAMEPTSMATRALLFRAISTVVGSPGWKLLSAKAKSKLADLIAASRFVEAAKILEPASPSVRALREAMEDITKDIEPRPPLSE